jgi:hypothetical protein
MSNVLGTLFKDIADSIRSKTGETGTMKPAEFPDKIAAIEAGGGTTVYEFLSSTMFTNEYMADIGAFAYFVPMEESAMEAWAANTQAVTVVYDGEEYNLTPQVVTGADGNDGVCVGNLTAFGGTGNGEPFAVVPWYVDGTPCFLIGSTVDAAPTEHTIRIYQESSSGSIEGIHIVTFMSEDGTTVLYERPVADGDNCANVVDRGLLATPTKESTAQYDYAHSGWSLTSGGSASASALSAVTEDRVVYAAFTSAVRYYTITYYDSDGVTVLKTESKAYGSTPAYMPQKSGYSFNGWTPALAAVTGDASYQAAWQSTITFAGGSWADIAEISEKGEAANTFKIGDTRTELIGDVECTLEIIGFNHDEKADGSGKAGITVWCKNSMGSKKYNIANSTPWNTGQLHVAEEAVYDTMTPELQAVIKRVNKKYHPSRTSDAVSTEPARIWSLSWTELGYRDGTDGTAYAAFSTGKNYGSADKYDDLKIGMSFWTRTYHYKKGAPIYVNSAGYFYSGSSNLIAALIVGFCI